MDFFVVYDDGIFADPVQRWHVRTRSSFVSTASAK
jgi:hypothetical protein